LGLALSSLIYAQPLQTLNQFPNSIPLLQAPIQANTLAASDANFAFEFGSDGQSIYYLRKAESGIELVHAFGQKKSSEIITTFTVMSPTTVLEWNKELLLVGVPVGLKFNYYRVDIVTKKLIDSAPFLENAILFAKHKQKGTLFFVVNQKGEDRVFRFDAGSKVPVQSENIMGMFVAAICDSEGKQVGYISYFENHTHFYLYEKREAKLVMKRPGISYYESIHYTPDSKELLCYTSENNAGNSQILKLNFKDGKSEEVIDSKKTPYCEVSGWQYNIKEKNFDFISYIDSKGNKKNLTYTSNGKKLVEFVSTNNAGANFQIHFLGSFQENSLFQVFGDAFPTQIIFQSAGKFTSIFEKSTLSGLSNPILINHRTLKGGSGHSWIYLPKVSKDAKTPVAVLINNNPLKLHSRELNALAQFLTSNGYTVVLWNTLFSSNYGSNEGGTGEVSERLHSDLEILLNGLEQDDLIQKSNVVLIGSELGACLIPFAMGNAEITNLHGITYNGSLSTPTTFASGLVFTAPEQIWPEFGTMKFGPTQQLICIGGGKSNESACKNFVSLRLNASYQDKTIRNGAGSLNFILNRLNELFQTQGSFSK
jgi:hypothetical protein